jgi:L-amino acid N-acyltransferase YncA
MDGRRLREEFRFNLQHFGGMKTLGVFSLRAINRLLPLRVRIGMVLEKVESKSLETDPRFRCGFLSPERLIQFADRDGYTINARSLDRACRNGDECYAILDGDRLASLGWYAVRPTVNDEFLVSFNSGHVYMHKGYTHPDYRGQRLHAVGMARALREYQQRGFRGIISDVDARNLSSLKSVHRLGYRDIGKAYMFRAMGRDFTFSDRGCRKYGLRFDPAPEAGCTSAHGHDPDALPIAPGGLQRGSSET